MRTLILRNPSNYCYMNAAFRTLLWALTLDATLDALCLRRGLSFAKFLFQRKDQSTLLAGQLGFAAFLQEWRSPKSQHDCAEFLHHVIRQFGPALFEGRWEARRVVDPDSDAQHCVMVDEGHCSQAITLDLPAGDRHTIQYLLHLWHDQAHVHALQAAPPLLFLRVSRYRLEGSNPIRNPSNLVWKPVVHIPLFRGPDIRESGTVAYEIIGVINHHGDSPQTGHYTVQLHAASGSLRCDDNVPPTFTSATGPNYLDTTFHSDEGYIFMCRRGDSMDSDMS